MMVELKCEEIRVGGTLQIDIGHVLFDIEQEVIRFYNSFLQNPGSINVSYELFCVMSECLSVVLPSDIGPTLFGIPLWVQRNLDGWAFQVCAPVNKIDRDKYIKTIIEVDDSTIFLPPNMPNMRKEGPGCTSSD